MSSRFCCRRTSGSKAEDIGYTALFLRIVLQGDERPRGPVAVGYQNVDEDPDLERTPNNGYVPSTTEATTAWTAGGMLASAGDLARAGDGVFRGSFAQ